MVYFFCGHRGCGKNYLANQISSKKKIITIDTGPIIRQMYNKYNTEGKILKKWIADNETQYGKEFSNKLICENTQVNIEQDYIIIGYRSMEGIKYFNNFFNITDYRIIYIDGDYELFRHNYNDRENKNLSKQEYEEIIKIEELMGINEVKIFSKNNTVYGEYYYKTQNNDTIYNSIARNLGINSEEIER